MVVLAVKRMSAFPSFSTFGSDQYDAICAFTPNTAVADASFRTEIFSTELISTLFHRALDTVHQYKRVTVIPRALTRI